MYFFKGLIFVEKYTEIFWGKMIQFLGFSLEIRMIRAIFGLVGKCILHLSLVT